MFVHFSKLVLSCLHDRLNNFLFDFFDDFYLKLSNEHFFVRQQIFCFNKQLAYQTFTEFECVVNIAARKTSSASLNVAIWGQYRRPALHFSCALYSRIYHYGICYTFFAHNHIRGIGRGQDLSLPWPLGLRSIFAR